MQRDLGPAEASSDLMAGDVRDYLINHPDFLNDNADLLVHLVPPSKVRGTSVEDFQHYMLTRLQENLQQVQDEHDDLMLLMQEHMQRQSRLNAVQLSLMDTENFETLLKYLAQDLCLTLDQEGVALFLEAQGELQEGMFCGLRIVEPGFVHSWMQGRDVVLQEPEKPITELFGTAAETIRSMALVRLSINDNLPPGMLALGHRETLYYSTGLATEQMQTLASVIERCWRKWL